MKQLKEGLGSPERAQIANVVDFDEKESKPKTTLEKIRSKPKVSEYAQKTKLFLENEGDGELTFEDHQKRRKKGRKGPKSKSKTRKRKVKREEKSEESNLANSILNWSEDKVNKSALKSKSKLPKSSAKGSAKKSVRIRKENESIRDSLKGNEDSRSRRKIQFNLEPDLYSEEEKETGKAEQGRKNKKKKIRQTKIRRRKTQKLPKNSQFKELEKRMSVRI